DDADQAPARQLEGEVLEEEVVAVSLRHPLRLDHQAAEARPRRNVDLDRLGGLLRLLGEELLVRRETRLPLGLAGARRHAHPLQLALEGALPRPGLLLLLRQARPLLLEPGGVVPLPRDAGAA